MSPGDLLCARRSFSFAWPTPESSRRVEIRKGDVFKVEKVLTDASVRVTVDRDRVDLKIKHFERVAS